MGPKKTYVFESGELQLGTAFLTPAKIFFKNLLYPHMCVLSMWTTSQDKAFLIEIAQQFLAFLK